MLFLRSRVEVVAVALARAEIPDEPNPAPEVGLLTRTVLKYTLKFEVVADPVMLIPITPFADVEMGAVKLPIRLLESVTVLEVVELATAIPLTTDPAAVPLRS